MEDNMQLDLGSMTLYDSTPLAGTPETIEDVITQKLVNNIYYVVDASLTEKKREISALQSLPEEEQIHDFEVSKLYLKLPEVSILLPRSRKIPDEKIPTKWENFAKEKGIKKKKKFSHKYDSEIKQNVARWGSKSKKNVYEPAIMEEKQPGRNPFLDSKTNKNLEREKQKLRQLKNKNFALEKRKKL